MVQLSKKAVQALDVFLLVGIVVAGFLFCLKRSVFQAYYFTSDTLYMPSFFRTLRDGTFDSFQFSHLPNILPDAIVIVPLLAAGLSVPIAYSIFSCLIFFVLALSVIKIAEALAVSNTGTVFYLFCILAFALFLCHPGRYLQTLMIGLHGGSFVVSLCCAAGARKLLSAHGKGAVIGTMFLSFVIGLATFSDVLFIVEFVIPFAAATTAIVVFDAWDRKRQAVLLNLFFIASAAFGKWGLALIPVSPFPPASLSSFILNIAAFLHSKPIFMLLPSFSVFGFLVLCVMPFAQKWLHHFQNLFGHRDVWTFYGAFGTVASLLGITLTAAAYEDFGAYRYAVAFFWWPVIFGLVFVDHLLAGEIWRRWMKGGALLSLGILIMLAIFWPGSEFWAPKVATCLRENAKVYGLHAGIAEYWTARPLTELSDGEIVVSQVTRDGSPMPWINNMKEYFAGYKTDKLRDYDFVITKDLDKAQLSTKFGDPTQIIDCDGYEVWQYAHPDQMQKALFLSGS